MYPIGYIELTEDTMPEQVVTPPIMTVGDLKKYLDIYHDDLLVTVLLPSGEHVGVLDASTTVLQPGTVLAFSMTTIKATTGKKVAPVVIPA